MSAFALALTVEGFNETTRWGWFRVDRDLTRLIEATCGSMAMLLYILILRDARFADGVAQLGGCALQMRVGEAILGQEKMAERLGCGRKPVRTSLDRLYKHGFLVRLDARQRLLWPWCGPLPTFVQLPHFQGLGVPDEPMPGQVEGSS